MGVGVDQAGRDQGAAEVLHVVDIDDVFDDARQAGRQLRRGACPGNSIFLHENGSITPYLRTGPQPADIGKKPEAHLVSDDLLMQWRYVATEATAQRERKYHIGCVALLHYSMLYTVIACRSGLRQDQRIRKNR